MYRQKQTTLHYMTLRAVSQGYMRKLQITYMCSLHVFIVVFLPGARCTQGTCQGLRTDRSVVARLSLIRFTMKKTETGLCSPYSPALAAEYVAPSLVTSGDNGSNRLDPFTDWRMACFRGLGLARSPSRK